MDVHVTVARAILVFHASLSKSLSHIDDVLMPAIAILIPSPHVYIELLATTQFYSSIKSGHSNEDGGDSFTTGDRCHLRDNASLPPNNPVNSFFSWRLMNLANKLGKWSTDPLLALPLQV